jgi:cysteine desulfurase
MSRVTYLDYNATTPVDPRVVERFLPFVTEIFGNAASEHVPGRDAREAVEAARSEVAEAIGARPSTIIFTSGATESINLALKGIARGSGGKRKIVTFTTEHKATLDTCAWLESEGVRVERVPADRNGLPDLSAAADAIDDQTVLVSVMAANNETGVISPLREIVALSRRVGALVHCDATQALGKMPFDVEATGVDFASISSHKVYGPKGVGALFVRRVDGVEIVPLIHGGGHERGLRSGTLNTPGIVGFGAAAAIAVTQLAPDSARIDELRRELEAGILCRWPDAEIIGRAAPRLPNTLNVHLPGLDAGAVLLAMPSIAASTGSACTASSPAPSHVLRAMGLDHEEAQECIRFSLGRFTTGEDITAALDALTGAIDLARGLKVATA